MTHDDAFLRAICEQPDDDVSRLIYADWLEERGDPRGEFIRVQCALADAPHTEYLSGQAYCFHNKPNQSCYRCHALRTRERELLLQHSRFWSSSLLGAQLCTWRRGFVARIDLRTQTLLDHAAALFAAAPITEVRLSDREPDDWSGSWTWYKGAGPHHLFHHGLDRQRADIPAKLWPPWLGIDQLLRRFDTHEAATKALSDWCVDYGRRTVGLPRFPQQCPDCGGTGERSTLPHDLSSGPTITWPCGRCKISGWIDPV